MQSDLTEFIARSVWIGILIYDSRFWHPRTQHTFYCRRGESEHDNPLTGPEFCVCMHRITCTPNLFDDLINSARFKKFAQCSAPDMRGDMMNICLLAIFLSHQRVYSRSHQNTNQFPTTRSFLVTSSPLHPVFVRYSLTLNFIYDSRFPTAFPQDMSGSVISAVITRTIHVTGVYRHFPKWMTKKQKCCILTNVVYKHTHTHKHSHTHTHTHTHELSHTQT